METNSTMLQGAETNPPRAHHGSTSLLRAGAITARGLHTKLALVLVLITGILVGVSSAGAEQMPSGTIELSGGSVAAGVGYTWGNGTLIFEGKKYPIKVQGLSIVRVGVSDYTASGAVYNLEACRYQRRVHCCLRRRGARRRCKCHCDGEFAWCGHSNGSHACGGQLEFRPEGCSHQFVSFNESQTPLAHQAFVFDAPELPTFSDQAPSFHGMPATPFIYLRGLEKALSGKPIQHGNRQ
jgi:hypothetical protein